MHTSQPRAPLFPYTTLFRSGRESAHRLQQIAGAHPGPLHRVNQEVANGKQRAEVQPVMDEAGMLEQLGRATDVISKLRRSEEHTSELQSRLHLVCRLLLEKK